MILVTGGTGKVGEAVVAELARLEAPFRIGTRSPQKAGPNAVAFDFDRPETFAPALAGIQTLFLLTSGGTQREVPVVDAARKAGVRRIVKLSVWKAEEEGFAFGRAHREVEKAIEASGISHTFLRPNGFMQNFSTAMAPTIRQQGAFYFPVEFRHSIIDVRDIGAVAARALTGGGAARRGALPLSGPESLSNEAIAAKLSKAVGKTIRFVTVPEPDFRQALVSAGMPSGYADAYLDLIRYYATGAAEEVTRGVEQVTGRPPIAFDRFAKDHTDAWR